MMVIPQGKALRMTMAVKQTGQPSFLCSLANVVQTPDGVAA